MFIKATTKEMIKRLFVRSAVLLIMSFAGWFLMDLIVESARAHGNTFVTRFPEFLLILRALAILAWIDVSIMWIRLALQPLLDIQKLALMAIEQQDTKAAAVIYVTNQLMIALRIFIALKLAELV
jgi:hypothetical protein